MPTTDRSPSARRAHSTRSILLAALAATSMVPAAHANASTGELDAPILSTVSGGLKAYNLQFSPAAVRSISAFPLQSPSVTGFTPLVATTLTDRQGPDDLQFTAISSGTKVGTGLGGGYTYLATLDSGGQSHILSGDDAAAVDVEAAGRLGGYSIDVQGASGVESLSITDPLGIYVTGVGNLTSGPGMPLAAPTNFYRGQIHTAVLTATPDSVLPSIVGVPMLAHYAVNIRNSDTRRIVKPDGSAVRTPNIDFVSHGAGTVHQFKLSLDLRDPLGAAASEPAFIPSFEDFQDFSDNPTSPTFWTFPIAQTNLGHTDGSLTQQEFLFDTGAQVSVLSEATADALGFDVGTDEADFTIDVLGVGGIRQAKGFFLERLELPVIGGDAVFTDVPVIVLNVTDPRDGIGFIPGIIGMNLFNDRDMTLDLNRSDPNVTFSAPITAKWKLTTGGAWLPDANWVLGVPDGTDVPANFLDTITAASTITVDGDYTIGSMRFDSPNAYTLNGTGRLTFETLGRPSTINVDRGQHTVNAPLTLGSQTRIMVSSGAQLTLGGETASPDAYVEKTGVGNLRLKNARFAGLAVSGGNVQILSGLGNASTGKVGALSFASGGTLDLTDSKLIIDDDAGDAALQSLAAVQAQIVAGQITSTMLNGQRAIGYGSAAALGLTSFGGLAIDGDAILIALTRRGDADLNGSVGFDDLLRLAQNYNGSNRYWTGGDFDHDGSTDFDDLLALASNYNSAGLADASGSLGAAGIGEAFAADWALAVSLVPEPGTLIASVGLLGIVSRRRR